jgi:hypothetical protein
VPGNPLECDDGNVCTDDGCEDGKCVHLNNQADCDDANSCTSGDQCVAGSCVGSGPALECNDGQPCTDDLCDPEHGCVFVNNNANSCSDGNACTVNDVCLNGNCVSESPADCSSAGGACATAVCDPSGAEGNCDAVTPLPDDSACSDGNACTVGDVCSNGSCTGGSTPDCSSVGGPCATATCDPTGLEGNCEVVSPLPNGAECSDGNACIVGESCQDGECSGGAAPDCGSSNTACRTASCDPGGLEGNCAVLTPRPDGTSCDDSNACTQEDR